MPFDPTSAQPDTIFDPTTAAPDALQRAPGATGFGMVGELIDDLTHQGPTNHDPNALERGIMGVAAHPLVRGAKATFQQAATTGLFAEPARAVMEGINYGRKPGESDAAFHQRYNNALTAARQQTTTDAKAAQLGSYGPGSTIGQKAERFGQQALNLGANVTANPEYFLLPGMGIGPNAATRIAVAGAGNAAIGGLSDAAAQIMDQVEGAKKDFDVKQNLEATITSGLFGAGMHGAIEVAPFIKDMFTKRGVDTKPAADPRGSPITPMSTDHVAVNQADAMQYKQVLQTGSVDDIKEFFKGRNGPQPSWADINTWVEHRDANVPNAQHTQPNFDYETEYNKHAEKQYNEQNRSAVEEHINNQMSGWKNAPEVEVIHGPEDIEHPEIKKQALKEDVNGDALGFLGSDGKIRVFSGRITDPDTANAVLFHEGLGHFGLAEKFGGRLDQVLKSLLSRNVNQLSRDTDAWMKRNPGAYGGDRIRAAEEVLAEASEKGQVPISWKNAMSSAIRQFGRKMGLKLAYSDAEVQHILAMAHDAVVNGKSSAAANGFRGAKQDQNKYMFTGQKAHEFDPESATAYTAKDGHVRNEIDDYPSKINEVERRGDYNLEEVLDHPELYRNYPQLRELPIRFDKLPNGEHGYYETSDPHIGIDVDTDNLHSSILHEVQHAIQHIEGQIGDSTHGTNKLDEEGYRGDPLEQEAFATEDRKYFTPEVRAENPPKFKRQDNEEGVSRRDFLRGVAASPIASVAKATEKTPVHPDVETILNNINQMEPVKATKLAETVAKTSKNPAYRALASKLSKLLGDATVEKVNTGGGSLDVLGITRSTEESGWHPGDITLYYSPDDITNGLNEETVLHEMLHSAIVQRYGSIATYLDHNRALLHDTAPRYGDEAVNDFRTLWDGLSEAINNASKESQLKIPDDVKNSPGFSEFMRSPDEALSWALTDPALQHWLKSVDDQGRAITDPNHTSVWHQIVDFVRKLLGLKSNFPTTALEKIMGAGNKILDRAQLDAPDHQYTNAFSQYLQHEEDAPQHTAKFITRAQLEQSRAQAGNGYKATDEDLESIVQHLEANYTPNKVSDAEVRSSALEYGITPSKIKDLKQRDPGELAARITRMGMAADYASMKARNLLDKLDTPDWSLGDHVELAKIIAERNYLIERYKGEGNEYARALRAMRAFQSYKNDTISAISEKLHDQDAGGLAILAEGGDEALKFARQLKDALGSNSNPKGAQQLMDNVSKPYWEQYLNTFHMNMMLSALSTHVKAPVDMATGISRDVIERALSIPVGAARQMFEAMTGRKATPGVEYAELEGQIYGLIRAVTDGEVYKRVAHAAKTGEGAYVDAKGKATPVNFMHQYGATSNPDIPVVGIPSHLISAQDTYFRSVAMNQNLYALGRREARLQLGPKASIDDVRIMGDNLARNPTPTMLKEAVDLSNRTLLLNHNPLNNMVDKWRSYRPGLTPWERIGRFVVFNLAPFIRVESNNLINRVIQRSPIGFIDPYTRGQLKAGGAKADIALTKIIYGTALMGLYWAAADKAKDKLMGEGPEGVDKFKEAQAAGFSPRSVHENGRYNVANSLSMSVNPFDVHNATATMIAELREAYEKGANKGQVGMGLKLGLGSILHNLTDMSWISDFAPVSDAMTAHRQEDASTVAKFTAGEVRSWSPNLMSQAARLNDPAARDTKPDDADSILGRTANELKSTVPGLRESLPIKYSVYGTPLPNGASLTGVHTWIPGLLGNGTTETHDPAEMELDRLTKSGLRLVQDDNNILDLNKSALITPVSKSWKMNVDDLQDYRDSGRTDLNVDDNGNVTLTPAQFEEYQRVAGRSIVETVRSEMSTPEWQKMSDEDKVLEVRKVQTEMKSVAKEALFDK